MNTACNGYCLPHKYWTQRINKLAKLSDNSKYSTISANLVIDLKPGRRPIINVDYHMTDIRMFVSVTTLSTILTTATQCMVLNSLRAKASNAQPAAKPTKSPAPQLAPNASEEDSGIVRALKSAQVKVRAKLGLCHRQMVHECFGPAAWRRIPDIACFSG